MNKFSALADPNRISIIDLLAANGPLPATSITQHFKVSGPAISQHLKVLREAELVSMIKNAQQRIYLINPDAILEVEIWAQQTNRLWNMRFDKLEDVLKDEANKIGVKNDRKY